MTAATLRPAADVAVAVVGGVTFVARLPHGPMQALSGSGGVIWHEAVAGDRAQLVDRVAARTGESVGSVRPHVEAYVDDLLAHGLLVEAGSVSGESPP